MTSFGRWSAYSSFGQTIRILFFSSNIFSLIFLFGIVLYSAWIYQTRSKFEELLSPSTFVDICKIMFTVSILGLLNGTFAIYSVLKELRCLIYSFVTANVVISILLIICSVLSFVFQTKLIQIPLHLKMSTSLKELYGSEDMPQITLAWNDLQTTFQCCGVNGTDNYKLWRNSKWHMHHLEPKPIIPKSCCKEKMILNCQKLVNFSISNMEDYFYTDTCYMPLRIDLLLVMQIAAWTTLIESIILLISAIFGGIFAKLVKK